MSLLFLPYNTRSNECILVTVQGMPGPTTGPAMVVANEPQRLTDEKIACWESQL